MMVQKTEENFIGEWKVEKLTSLPWRFLCTTQGAGGGIVSIEFDTRYEFSKMTIDCYPISGSLLSDIKVRQYIEEAKEACKKFDQALIDML